jgi:hypothetical protein
MTVAEKLHAPGTPPPPHYHRPPDRRSCELRVVETGGSVVWYSGGGWIVMEFVAGTLIGVLIGFLCGYGVRALISLRRHAAAETRRRARRGQSMILEIQREAERRRGGWS